MRRKKPKGDVKIDNHGTLFLIWPLTKRAEGWLHEAVSAESTWYGGALVVEPRYLTDIKNGMVEDGLIIGGE